MIPIRTRSLAAALVCAVAALGGCGDDPAASVDASPAPIDAAPREVVAADRSLLVGEIAEGILAGGAGDRAVIRVTAPLAMLDWNIHGHASGATQTVVEAFAVASVDYSFEPTAQADWYLLLRNKATAPMAVEVEIELYGTMQWSGWQ